MQIHTDIDENLTPNPHHVAWSGYKRWYLWTTIYRPNGLTRNTEAYIKGLDELELAWSERVAAKKPYIWQQNSEPCYTRKTT